MTPIPANIDAISIIQDLNRWGWNDYKIEIACGLSRGYVDQIKRGGVIQMSYQRAARLYNFWLEIRAESEHQSSQLDTAA